MLRAVRGLHAKVVIEGIVVAGEEADAVPAALPCPAPQLIDLCLRNECETRLLHDMGRDRVVAVGPHAAHHAGLIVPGRKHQVIDDQRVVPVCKKIGEPHIAQIRGIVAGEIQWSLPEDVVR